MCLALVITTAAMFAAAAGSAGRVERQKAAEAARPKQQKREHEVSNWHPRWRSRPSRPGRCSGYS